MSRAKLLWENVVSLNRAVDALYASFNHCFSPLGSPVSSSLCDQESKGNTQSAPPESLQ